MKISIIVSCHNCAFTLPGQLEALSRQAPDGECEILVIDNGSTDQTVAVAKRLRHSIPNLRVLQANERKGFAHARNIAVKKSTGRFLLFCDGNDIAQNQWVETMTGALENHPFVSGRLICTEINLAWTVAARPVEMQMEETAAVETFGHFPWASASNMGIHRELFEKTGGFNEDFTALEETDFSWRIQKLGIDLTPVPDSIVHYRLRKTAIGIFHQALVYSVNFVRLSDLHEENGFVPFQRTFVSRSWMWLLAACCLFTFRREHRGRLLWMFGWSAGSALGTVRCRWLGRPPSTTVSPLKNRLLRIFKSESPKHQPHMFP